MVLDHGTGTVGAGAGESTGEETGERAEGSTAFRVRAAGTEDEATLSVRVTDPDGSLIGGLSGWTWGGCGGIGLLWVRDGCRREGWGTRLLRTAEDEARRRGCSRMVVSSMSFQAPGFYRRHGYVETGRTERLPGGHCDVHFFKRLDGPSAAPRLRVAVVVDIPEEHRDAGQRYEDLVLPLMASHGGRLEQRLRTEDSCTEVHLLSFASREGYEAFVADPRRAEYREQLGDVRLTSRVLEVHEVIG
ncbi:GNAT family N-acetyltransferase [Rugosimonospora africana]|nr:GNAT family N-acetyltransferase [Rugosimonospora africana]